MKIHCHLNQSEEESLKKIETKLEKDTGCGWAPPWEICILDFSTKILTFNECYKGNSDFGIEVSFEKLLEAVKLFGNLPPGLNYGQYEVKKSGSGFASTCVGKIFHVIAYDSTGYSGNPGFLLADYTNTICKGYVGVDSFIPESFTPAKSESTTSVSFLAYETDNSDPTALIKLFTYIESKGGDTSIFNGYRGLLNQRNEIFYFDSKGVFSGARGDCPSIERHKPQPYVPSNLLSFEDFIQKALAFGYVKDSLTRTIIRQYLKSLAISKKEVIVTETKVEHSPSLSPNFDVAIPSVEQKGYVISKDLHVSVNFQKKQKKNFIIN